MFSAMKKLLYPFDSFIYENALTMFIFVLFMTYYVLINCSNIIVMPTLYNYSIGTIMHGYQKRSVQYYYMAQVAAKHVHVHR